MPFRRRPRRLSRNQRVVNRNRARNRAPGETRRRHTEDLEDPQTWKILTKQRCCPRRATAIVHALLVLHHIEHPP
jgi:hypothetical protein